MIDLTHLSKLILIELFNAFELSSHWITARSGEQHQGVADWELTSRFKESIPETWLICIDHTRDYLADVNYAPVLVKVVYDDDSKKTHYRCPRTYALHELALNDTAIYRVDEMRFIQGLTTLLGIPYVLRRPPPVMADMWALGSLELSGDTVTVLAIRNLDTNINELIRYLDQCHMLTLVLLMTNKKPILSSRNYSHITFIYIVDVLIESSERVTVDFSFIENLVKGTNRKGYKHVPPLLFDKERNVLSIQGLSDWHVKGEKQISAIRYMYQQTLNGHKEMSAKEILDAARVKGQVSGAKRMQSLFSSSEQWRDFIISPRRGIYRFNVVD